MIKAVDTLQTEREQAIADALDLLHSMEAEKFENVVIIGFRPGLGCKIVASKRLDQFALIGAIEFAKYDLLEKS